MEIGSAFAHWHYQPDPSAHEAEIMLAPGAWNIGARNRFRPQVLDEPPDDMWQPEHLWGEQEPGEEDELNARRHANANHFLGPLGGRFLHRGHPNLLGGRFHPNLLRGARGGARRQRGHAGVPGETARPRPTVPVPDLPIPRVLELSEHRGPLLPPEVLRESLRFVDIYDLLLTRKIEEVEARLRRKMARDYGETPAASIMEHQVGTMGEVWEKIEIDQPPLQVVGRVCYC